MPFPLMKHKEGVSKDSGTSATGKTIYSV